MNKQVVIAVALMSGALSPIGSFPCLGAESASSDVTRRASASSQDDQMNLLVRRLSESVTLEESLAAEEAILSSIESIDIHVSTNAVDDSVGIDLINGAWPQRVLGQVNFTVFPTNAQACLALARYVGTVKRTDYPSDLVRETLPIPIMRSLNGSRISEERLRALEAENERRSERRRVLGEECELQIRVFLANATVEGYRRQLLAFCGKSVAGCRNVMEDEEFATFTNQVVAVSCASEQEKRILLRDLANVCQQGTCDTVGVTQ